MYNFAATLVVKKFFSLIFLLYRRKLSYSSSSKAKSS